VKILYPSAFEEISPWAAASGVTVEEARVRFAQYGVLRAIADSRELSRVLVFKGGNALDFVWVPNRSTKDLDFSARETIEGEALHALLQAGLDAVGRRLGTLYRVHRVERQPPGPEKVFVTYAVRVGYALQDQLPLRRRLEAGQTSPLVIPLDVSLNEPICADAPVDVAGVHALRVSTREDIVAEKLRSLLQQPLRNRYRRQDLLDIAVILLGAPLDLAQVATFLERKAMARNVPVTRAAFRDPEVARRAGQDYAVLKDTTRSNFVPFDDALRALLDLVGQLQIPEE
jgi:predicted nucleotidyltransferase component of viral defense system